MVSSRSVLLALVLVATGCQSAASLGASCTSSGSCASPLVCRLGRCRNECTVNRDCPIGAQCFLDQSGLGACQLDVDHSCGSESCGAGLTCLSGACVRACSQPTDCPTDGTCAIASGAAVGVCSDTRGGTDAGTSDASVDGGVDGGVDASIDAGPPDASTSCAPLRATQVCAGIGFACALRTDHTVACWGEAASGTIGVDVATTCPALGVPEECATSPLVVPLEGGGTLTSVEEIGCGEDFACARTTDTHVRCWGRNYGSMLGVVGDGPRGAREVTNAGGIAITGVTQLAVGSGHTCALQGPSNVTCWGQNDRVQVGHGMTATTGELAAPSPALTSAGSIAALVMMSETTCVVHDGATRELHCLGSNVHGELGVDPATLTMTAGLRLLDLVTLRAGMPATDAFSGGNAHACALDADSHVQCWGYNDYDSLGRHVFTVVDEPVPAPLFGPASLVAFDALFVGTSATNGCAIEHGTGRVYCWGGNASGQLARDPAMGDGLDAAAIDALPPIAQGACGQEHCCAVDDNQQVWCWGGNLLGDLGRGFASAFEWHPAVACAAP